MTEREREGRRRTRSTARRGDRSALRWGGRLLAVAVAFGLGVAVGRAVEGGPKPGGSQTLVRTLVPTTIGPAERTVTVTVTTP